MELYICAYGNEQAQEKGIIKINYDLNHNKYKKKMLVSLEGKANMAVISGKHLYVSEQREDSYYLITYDSITGKKLEELKCEYFYSYGYYQSDLLYLASFNDGVDSIYDCQAKEMIKHVKHNDETVKTGRSHYIHAIRNNRFIAVDNALQKVYFYENENLEIEKVLSFPHINIRLLSLHPYFPYAYLNTEISNEVIVLNLDEMEVVNRVQMTSQEGNFSGGNALSEDGKTLAVSVRGENKIYIYNVEQGKEIHLKSSFFCGTMPRDLLIHSNYLFVSCTMENAIEVYDLTEYKKKTSIPLNQPITFGL